jgi:hypothetical protein
VRYDAWTGFSGAIPDTYPIMFVLRRLLIVLALALLAMQGASAQVRTAQLPPTQMMLTMVAQTDHSKATHAAVAAASHCPGVATGHAAGGNHDDCPGCPSACGIHCGALLAAYRLEPRAFHASLPSPLSEPLRGGVTHAPPVRPPIG